jgi:hypothetical protein
MKICWRSLMLGVLTAMTVACAHTSASTNPEAGRRNATSEGIFVTGSHVRQRVDSASGVPRTISPMRIYSREQIASTGRQGDLRAALRDLDPGFSR